MRPSRRKEGVKRARRIIDIWKRGTDRVSDIDYYYNEDSPLFKKMVYTRCMCSCPWCGNPRRHFGQKTRKEIIADDIMEYQIEDWELGDRYYYEDLWDEYYDDYCDYAEMMMLAQESYVELWEHLDEYDLQELSVLSQ